MFDHDHSAARGMMNARKLIVFKHSTALGNASAHSLFGLVKVQQDDSTPTPFVRRLFITIDKDKLPEGISSGHDMIEYGDEDLLMLSESNT